MKGRLSAVAGVSMLAAAMLLPDAALASSPQQVGQHQISVKRAHPGLADILAARNPNRTVTVAVQVKGQPVSVVEGTSGTLSSGRKQQLRGTLTSRQRPVASRLRSLGARIQDTYTDVFNGFRIRVKAKQIAKIERLPNVEAVLSVQRYHTDNLNTVDYLGADTTWGQTGRTGKGVKIAIIDTGINYYHLDFGGKGNSAWKADDPTKVEKGTFPTAKVVAGYDFVGDDYDADTQPVPHPDKDPIDCEGHGSHVAGTAAGAGLTSAGKTYTGSYNAGTLAHTDFRIGPGVAPQAKLMAYKVFGCEGTTDVVVDAIERAVRDGADIINMSLGSDFGTDGTLDAMAVDNAALAGVTVVVSSGNEGASAYMTGTPASATRSISVAAMDALPTFPAARVDMPSGADVQALNANNAKLPVTGKLNVFHDNPATTADTETGKGDESLGCFAQDYTYNHFAAGQIAVVYRGVCPRTDRAVMGQRKDAAAVVMINTVDGLPPYEFPITGVTIPFIGVGGEVEGRFTSNDGKTVTIKSAGKRANPGYQSMTSFTSAGPRRGDAEIKPDITAPGMSVFSVDAHGTSGGIAEAGTSMAAPAVAGVAALVQQAHPTWDPRDIKAAIIGTAATGKIDGYDVRFAGAGLAQPRRAVDTVAFAYTDPGSSSITFGVHQAGDTPGSAISFTDTQKLAIRNTSSRSITYDLRNSFNGDARGIKVSISPSRVTVPAKSKKTIAVKVTLSDSAVAALPAAALEPSVDSFGNVFTKLVSVRGAIVATPTRSGTGIYPIRVPWLVVPRGTSAIRQANNTLSAWTSSGAQRSATINFRNFGLHKGNVDLYAWGLSDGKDGVGEIDLRAAGVQSFPAEDCTGEADGQDRCVIFAVNTWHAWSNAAADEWDVLIDTNRDGDAEYLLMGIDDGLLFAGLPNGVLDAVVVDLAHGTLVDAFYAVAPTDSSTLQLPALASDFGLSKSGKVSFDYWVESSVVFGDAPVFDEMHTGDTRPNARFDPFHPAVSSGFFKALAHDKVARVPLKVDTSRLDVNRGQKGWMVVTLDDAAGATQADTVSIGKLP